MPNKRTEPNGYPVQLPALWKFLPSHRRTVGLILSGAAIAFIAGAMRFPWQATRSPLLHTHHQPKDLSDPVLALSSKAIVIDPATQAITLKAIESDYRP
jgi:multisubunit Na+/H+ antiporter MnhC subunit